MTFTSLSTLGLRSFASIRNSSAPSLLKSTVVPGPQGAAKIPSVGLRHASTATKASDLQMSWNDFFRLRKRRRAVGFATSFGTAATASAVAFQYFANLVIDFNQTFLGIEMQWIYLGGIAISGFLGWVVGPFVGNQVFNVLIGSSRRAFHQMDNVFLRHVARNRPNPVRHNVNTNPLPDYYGEKISSLHDYRQWLREGRLFEKKASKFL